MLLAVGGELLYLHHERNLPAKQSAKPDYGPIDPDDNVFLEKKRPSDMADIKQLDGQTLWVSAGGQMDYYPSDGHHADFSNTAGTLLGVEPIIVKGAFEQKASPKSYVRIPAGDRQVFLAFTMPKSADPKKEYAVPVGYRQGKDFTFYTDEIFFYKDPHILYSYWGPKIWQAIDTHQVVLGMNERQVQLSLGQVSKSVSNDYGNRLVIYSNLGHPMAVTFTKNHATAFRPDQGF